jgi:ABC-2 type transport system permease protein
MSEGVVTSAGFVTTEGRVVPVSVSLAKRNVQAIIRVPAAIIPTVVMPLFFVVAFSGSFNGLTQLPQFPTDNILNWMAPFAIVQGAAFGGLGIAFSLGRDLEDGFYDRLLIAPTPRSALLAGPILGALIRALLPTAAVLVASFAGGARMVNGPLGLITLLLACEGVALAAGLWGLGVVYRLKTQRAGALIQVGIFVTLFLTTGQVPLGAMEGWLHAVARINPMTNIMALAREGFVGDLSWANTWPGLVALAVFIAPLVVFAVRGLRKLVP